MNNTAKTILTMAAGAFVLTISAGAQGESRQGEAPNSPLRNKLIDVVAFENSAREALLHRKERRITEAQFIAMAKGRDRAMGGLFLKYTQATIRASTPLAIQPGARLPCEWYMAVT